jgi:hypothetical protein
VLDVRDAVENQLNDVDHTPAQRSHDADIGDSSEVREQLEDLGYM